MAQVVDDKKLIKDDEFGIHGNLTVEEADDNSYIALYDEEAPSKNQPAPISESPSLEEIQVKAPQESSNTVELDDAYFDDILSSEDIAPSGIVTPTVSHPPQEDDDGPISLTNEELDGILQTGPEDDEAFHPDFPVASAEEHPITPASDEPPTLVVEESPANEHALPKNPTPFEDDELPIALSDEDIDAVVLEEEGSADYSPSEISHPLEPLAPEPSAQTALAKDLSEHAEPDGLQNKSPLTLNEEPIALSDDELDNILADAEAELDEMPAHEGAHEGTHSQDEEKDEILTLDDDPGITLIDDSTASTETENASSDFFDSDEDEPITLSDEELDGILNTTAEEEDAPPPTEEIQLTHEEARAPHPVKDEEEPIALSSDELDGILMDAGEEVEAPGEEAPLADLPPEDDTVLSLEELPQQETQTAAHSDFFDSDEDEPIALSAEELDGIVATAEEEAPPLAEEKVEFDHAELDARYADVDNIDSAATPAVENTDLAPVDTEDDDGPIALSTEELDGIAQDAHEVTPEAPMVPLSPLDANTNEPSLSEIADKPATVFEEDLESATLVHEDDKVAPQAATPDQEELKSVMGYLDNLLGELPDDVIEKFAQSDYFKLYQKVMDKLGL